MIVLKVDEIQIPDNRFRRDFDPRKLNELKESIQRNGLWHPVVVEGKDGKWILRAGERRHRVLSDIAKEGKPIRVGSESYAGGLVPAVNFGELSELQRLEIEVEENVVRADFTWQERTRALAALHELRSRQNTKQTLTDTATEVLGKPAQGMQVSTVSEALIVAKHLDNPEVAKAKDQKEAVKIIKRVAESEHRAQLAKKYDLTKVAHKLLKGDALEILKTLPAESFDVVLTDPPYGIGADNFGDQASTGHSYEDSKTYFKQLSNVLAEESWRVAKAKAHAYIFCDVRQFGDLEALMCLAGWRVWPVPIIWYKGNGMLPQPQHGPRRTYECILYAIKGERETLQVKLDCITKIPGVKRLRHGAQKPVALYADLLSRSARPGDTVLDCFGGSGTVLVAANRAKLTATYIENNEEQYNIALQRATVSEIDDGAEEDDGIDLRLE